MTAKILASRDSLETELTCAIETLRLYVETEDRQEKTVKQINRCKLIFEKIIDKNSKLIDATPEEAEQVPYTEWLADVTEEYEKAVDEARVYLDSPAAKSVKAKSRSTSSASNAARVARLKVDQMKKQNDAADELAELELKLKGDKIRRQQELDAAVVDMILEGSSTSTSKNGSIANAVEQKPDVQQWADQAALQPTTDVNTDVVTGVPYTMPTVHVTSLAASNAAPVITSSPLAAVTMTVPVLGASRP
jgi:hypothetical protein